MAGSGAARARWPVKDDETRSRTERGPVRSEGANGQRSEAATGRPNHPWDPSRATEPGLRPQPKIYLVRGNPKSTEDVPGSGQRAVTTLARV